MSKRNTPTHHLALQGYSDSQHWAAGLRPPLVAWLSTAELSMPPLCRGDSLHGSIACLQPGFPQASTPPPLHLPFQPSPVLSSLPTPSASQPSLVNKFRVHLFQEVFPDLSTSPSTEHLSTSNLMTQDVHAFF